MFNDSGGSNTYDPREAVGPPNGGRGMPYMDQSTAAEFRNNMLGMISSALRSNLITVEDLQTVSRYPGPPPGSWGGGGMGGPMWAGNYSTRSGSGAPASKKRKMDSEEKQGQ